MTLNRRPIINYPYAKMRPILERLARAVTSTPAMARDSATPTR